MFQVLKCEGQSERERVKTELKVPLDMWRQIGQMGVRTSDADFGVER